MAGLIEEIQKDALDSSVPIEGLLRRVKLAAAKLKLTDLVSWVDQELNGYAGELPPYRKAWGQPAAWNPYNGWIPIHCGDERINEMISEARIAQSIASIRDLVERDKGSTMHFPIPAPLVEQLNQLMNFQTARMVIQIGRGHLVGILDTVRTLILDWAIGMEERGIVGEGISFNAKEKSEAQTIMANFTIGNIGSFVGNLGSGNLAGDITTGTVHVRHINELTKSLRSALPDLDRAGADREALEKSIIEIEAEVRNVTPDRTKLAGFLTDARAAVSGAAGNMIAEGAMAMIGAALSSLSS